MASELTLAGLTPAQAGGLYRQWLQFVQDDAARAVRIDAHPVGHDLFGLYRSVMHLATLGRDHVSFRQVPYGSLTLLMFDEEERGILGDAAQRIANAQGMRDANVRGFAALMEATITDMRAQARSR